MEFYMDNYLSNLLQCRLMMPRGIRPIG